MVLEQWHFPVNTWFGRHGCGVVAVVVVVGGGSCCSHSRAVLIHTCIENR